MLTRIFTCDRCSYQIFIRDFRDQPDKWMKIETYTHADRGASGLAERFVWYLCHACSAAFEELVATLGMIPPKGWTG